MNGILRPDVPRRFRTVTGSSGTEIDRRDLVVGEDLRCRTFDQLPAKYKVDTRVDNMGYWKRMAEAGLVPVAPMVLAPPPVWKTSKILVRVTGFRYFLIQEVTLKTRLLL